MAELIYMYIRNNMTDCVVSFTYFILAVNSHQDLAFLILYVIPVNRRKSRL